MIRTIVTLIAFNLWNIADLFSTRLIFDKFYVLGESKQRQYRYIWVIYSFVVTYVYCMTKIYRPGIICNIFFFLFYLRMVPFVWSAYGMKARVPAIIFFYEEAEAVISSTVTIIIIYAAKIDYSFHSWIEDMLATLSAVLFLVILLILQYLRRNRGLKIWFANLSVPEYLMLTAAIFFAGNLETAIWFGDYSTQSKVFVMILMALVLTMSFRLIFVNEKYFTMENLTRTLSRQMKDMTVYYTELSERDRELRKFRHDIKNHLFTVSSMIDEGNNRTAIEYLSSLTDEVSKKTSRRFNTGNYVVDSLLASKESIAKQHGTDIEFDGVVPYDGVDDVDMVIVFSNILDNALEACEKIGGTKKVIINSVYENRTWALEVINPVINRVNVINNHIDSTKDNVLLHGYGLSNIEDTVDRYNGTMNISCTKNEFSVRIVLPTR